MIVSPSLNSTFLPAGTTSLSSPARPTWESSPLLPAGKRPTGNFRPIEEHTSRRASYQQAGREQGAEAGKNRERHRGRAGGTPLRFAPLRPPAPPSASVRSASLRSLQPQIESSSGSSQRQSPTAVPQADRELPIERQRAKRNSGGRKEIGKLLSSQPQGRIWLRSSLVKVSAHSLRSWFPP